MAKANERMDQALAALLSDEEAKVIAALAYVQAHGDARAIQPMLRALARTSDAAQQQRIQAMLFEVKVKDAAAELVKALDEPALRPVRNVVLATFWNAGLDAAPHTERIIACAVEGSAEECFECLTVLENQELLPEKAVLKGIRTVSDAIAANTDEYKGAMLGSLLVELKARAGKE